MAVAGSLAVGAGGRRPYRAETRPKDRPWHTFTGNEWLVYGFLVVAAVAVSLPLYPYGWHTFMHIAGAVVFLGNIIVTAAWMLMADLSRSVKVMHFSAKAVIRADLLFTLPGVLLVLMNGFAMVFSRWGGRDALYDFTWISLALALFTVSGVIWVGRAHPSPASHGGVLSSVGLPGFTAEAVLLRTAQVVLLGWGLPSCCRFARST